MDELKKCPDCGGAGGFESGGEVCCGGSQWECGASGCTGPIDGRYLEECPTCEGSGQVLESRDLVTVTDEMVEVKISIHGCDDSTHLTRRMTKDQFTFLKEVAEQISEQSTYGCMPVMNAALTAALGGPHG